MQRLGQQRTTAGPYLTGLTVTDMSLVCFTGYCLPRSNVSYHAIQLLVTGWAPAVELWWSRPVTQSWSPCTRSAASTERAVA